MTPAQAAEVTPDPLPFALRTPRKAWHLGLAAFLAYTTIPLFSESYYSAMLAKGAYPVDADSISIPIHEEAVAWRAVAPFFVVLVLLALWRYPGAVSVGCWNRDRPVWSAFWTALFALAVGRMIPHGIDVRRWAHVSESLCLALWTWMLVRFRAALVGGS